MAKTTPTINGAAIPTTGITAKLVKYGTETRAADGTLYQTIRGQKWEWTVACEGVRISDVVWLATIAKSNSTQTFIDEDGGSFTVLVTMDEPYTHTVEQGGSERTYDVTLQLQQV